MPATCQQIIYVNLQGPNITKFYITFPLPFFSFVLASNCFLLIIFSKLTNVGHRFLIKMTAHPFPRHRVENAWWRAMTPILVGCVLEDIWKIECMALGFSILTGIFPYFKGQDLVSEQNHGWSLYISFPEPFGRLICRTETEEKLSFWLIEFFFLWTLGCFLAPFDVKRNI